MRMMPQLPHVYSTVLLASNTGGALITEPKPGAAITFKDLRGAGICRGPGSRAGTQPTAIERTTKLNRARRLGMFRARVSRWARRNVALRDLGPEIERRRAPAKGISNRGPNIPVSRGLTLTPDGMRIGKAVREELVPIKLEQDDGKGRIEVAEHRRG